MNTKNAKKIKNKKCDTKKLKYLVENTSSAI